jgi:flagellar motor switch protein FliN/FliY
MNSNPASSPPNPSLEPIALPKLRAASPMSFLKDVEVEITLEIGRRKMRIADVLKLASGQTLELAKAAGEPLDIFVNGRLLGRGEAVVAGDRYGVRITEIVAPSDEGRS